MKIPERKYESGYKKKKIIGKKLNPKNTKKKNITGMKNLDPDMY